MCIRDSGSRGCDYGGSSGRLGCAAGPDRGWPRAEGAASRFERAGPLGRGSFGGAAAVAAAAERRG
eukprot:6018756-Alexandrium_andersonii.AAC.1